MTNYDRIKQMSVEEMAVELIKIAEDDKLFDKFITSYDCRHCEEMYCAKCMKQWLEMEVEK